MEGCGKFPVGTEFEHLDAIYGFNWDFKNLEEALEEGGFLHGKKVYVFGFAEPQHFKHIIHVPTVNVIDSTIEPSNKVAIASIQSAREETITMKEMRMGWFPLHSFTRKRQTSWENKLSDLHFVL